MEREKDNLKVAEGDKKWVSSKSEKKDKVFEKRSQYVRLKTEKLETKRPVTVTKGGPRFGFTSLVLVKDEERKAIAFACASGKDVVSAFRKSVQKAQKKLVVYFPEPLRTIPYQVLVKDGATKIFLKPAPPGNGIKAGGILSKLFKYLEIKDISAKIIGSRNKMNVIRVAFMCLDKITGKKYDY